MEKLIVFMKEYVRVQNSARFLGVKMSYLVQVKNPSSLATVQWILKIQKAFFSQ